MKTLQYFLPFLLLPLAAPAQSFFNSRWHASAPLPPPHSVQRVVLPPAATLYVSTPQGIVAYSASRAGAIKQLTAPVRVAGNLVGASTTRLITLDAGNLHAYALSGTGAIAGLTASVPTASYSGAECGAVSNATLNQGLVYVERAGAADAGGDNICDAIQTFKLDSSGLIFEGAIIYDQNRFAIAATPLVFSSNFAYDLTPIGDACEQEFNAFSREPSGALDPIAGIVTEPLPDGGLFFPLSIAADFGNHLAILVQQDFEAPCGPMGPVQLASFTVHPDGSLVSTNSYQDMPVVANVSTMKFGPAGAVLAVAGDGLTLYHFNGPAPITAMTRNLLPGVGISAIGFDNLHHLYAWGIDTDRRFKLFSFTITNTSVTRSVPVVVSSSSTGMIVVSR